MDERYTDLAVHIESVDSRCRSNEHRISEHDSQIKELHAKQDAIYELTSSVKSIATDMTYIKEDVKEVKSGQEKLNEKVTILENKPATETKKRVDGIVGSVLEKLIWIVVGGIAVYGLSMIVPNIPW